MRFEISNNGPIRDSVRNRTRSSAIAEIADRTACSILTLFIAISTSRPLNKKIRSLATVTADLRPQSAVRTPLLQLQSQASAGSLASACPVIVDNRAVRIRLVCLSPLDTYGVSHFVFVVHFVAKRYILEQKCLKGRIGTCILGTRWNNF